jgi:hypothetical protein
LSDAAYIPSKWVPKLKADGRAAVHFRWIRANLMPVKFLQDRSVYAYSAVIVLIMLAAAFASYRPYSRQGIAKPAKANAITREISGPRTPVLNVESITPYGHIVEIVAGTDPGTIVMVNGERAAVIFAGSRIRHFVGPLPDGVTVITITAQNDEGGVNTKKVAIALP